MLADLLCASIHIGSYYHVEPVEIFRPIARGVLGPAAMKGAWGSASPGIALELTLTLIMATVYVIAAIHIADLRKSWSLLGPCYGMVVMVAMYTLVLPHCAVPESGALSDGPRGPTGRITDHQMFHGTILVHMIVLRLVISACTRLLWPTQESAAG